MNRISWLMALILTCVPIMGFSEEPVAVEISDWRPYIYMENGKPTGSSYPIVEAVFERAKVPYEFSIKPWSRVYSDGLERENYFISGIGRTQEREALFQWVGLLTKKVDVYFYKLKSNPVQIANLAEAQQYTIGAEADSYYHDFLKSNFEPSSTYPIPFPEQLISMLMAERLDFVLLEESRVMELSEDIEVDHQQFEKALFAFSAQNYLAASLKTDKALVDRLKEAYVSLEKDNLLVLP